MTKKIILKVQPFLVLRYSIFGQEKNTRTKKLKSGNGSESKKEKTTSSFRQNLQE